MLVCALIPTSASCLSGLLHGRVFVAHRLKSQEIRRDNGDGNPTGNGYAGLSENSGFLETWIADPCGSTDAGLCCSKRRPPRFLSLPRSSCLISHPPLILTSTLHTPRGNFDSLKAALDIVPVCKCNGGANSPTTSTLIAASTSSSAASCRPVGRDHCRGLRHHRLRANGLHDTFQQHDLYVTALHSALRSVSLPVSLSTSLVRHAILVSFSSHT